ncbi:TonB-dependent receptor plug domain-containing protein [Paracoccus cavernae]|uniref:TonB-dependent receptor plug domain-containing protein n=1 Tax=Paracoccus cavernae TaxID=1571207 RepID=A0ABT8DB41_9RHOB|nr:TonB-dependent receptor plug domain-containing protein [Paracoccus cavernae]MDN3713814.1 TonB-dependent receptor plug domain-containing protein [Paracoccus cavernae]
MLQRLALAGCILPGLAGGWAQAQELDLAREEVIREAQAQAAAGKAFVLGTIVLTASGEELGAGGTTAIVDSEEILHSNRQTLDDAMRVVPGVSVGNTGGSRNERLISVRGFDRLQVPLSVDGIRVYLPADNRLDFGRFLTPDLAEVQVQKGYVSVLNGPGAMGGAINLVTRKPTAPSRARRVWGSRPAIAATSPARTPICPSAPNRTSSTRRAAICGARATAIISPRITAPLPSNRAVCATIPIPRTAASTSRSAIRPMRTMNMS